MSECSYLAAWSYAWHSDFVYKREQNGIVWHAKVDGAKKRIPIPSHPSTVLPKRREDEEEEKGVVIIIIYY